MTEETRVGRGAFLAVLGLLLVRPGPVVHAEGLPMGHFIFYPSVEMELANDENVFNRSENLFDITDTDASPVIEDQRAQLRAPMLLKLPFRESHWQLGYTPELNQYQDTGELDGDAHEVSTELSLVFSTGVRLVLGGQLSLDYLNSQAFDPGGEVVFSFRDYTLTSFWFDYEQPLGQRSGLLLEMQRDSLEFDQEFSSFVEYTDLEGVLSYVHLLAPDLRLFAGLTGGSNDIDRTDFESEEDHWTRLGFQVGMERRFDRRNTARFDVGYEELSFDHSDDSDFSGLVLAVAYRRKFTDALHVQGELVREPTQSSFDVNNYYVSNRLTLSSEFRTARSLYYFGNLTYRLNQYPDETVVTDPGSKREDRDIQGRLGIGFQLSQTHSVRVSYSARDRTSNLRRADDGAEVFNFTDGVFSIVYRYGFSADRDYI